jgi:hypothetical protein
MGEPVRTPQEADPEGEQLLTFNRACAADARAGNGAEPGPPAKRKEGTRTVRGGLIMGQDDTHTKASTGSLRRASWLRDA